MGQKRKGNSSFLLQGSILAAASLISRIIGLLYRVPMTAILGDVGNNYYSCAFEIYNVLLLISSFSLPLAVSKLVSARIAKGEKKNAYRIVKSAFLFAVVSGACAGFIVFFGAEFITGTLLKTPMSVYALKVLAPTLVVVAVLGVLRGFFQGLGTMVPSAVSQIIEQLINAVVSIGAAHYLYQYGMMVGKILGDSERYGAAYGAAGGTLGTSMGAVAGFLFLLFVFFAYRRIMKKQTVKEKDIPKESYLEILKVLVFTIIPVLLSTTIYNISGIIDQGIFKNLALYQGHSSEEIEVWWGVFSGKYKLMINVPISIVSAVAASCVPSVAAAFANRRMENVCGQIQAATRFIMAIAFPCTTGMAVLAGPIMQLVLGDSSELSAHLLMVGAVSILFYSLSTLSNGILQGINRLKVPVKNAAAALVMHLILLIVLLLGIDLNIYAVVYANAFFALVMCILNERAIRRYSHCTIDLIHTFVIPGISSAIMGILVWLIYRGGMQVSGSNRISAILSIAAGVAVYGICMLLLGGITEEDLYRVPKGRIIAKTAKKLHLLK